MEFFVNVLITLLILGEIAFAGAMVIIGIRDSIRGEFFVVEAYQPKPPVKSVKRSGVARKPKRAKAAKSSTGRKNQKKAA